MEYRVKVKGYLNDRNVDWLDGFKMSLEDGNTIIYGDIQDQSALFGILKRIQDKGIYLISINREDK